MVDLGPTIPLRDGIHLQNRNEHDKNQGEKYRSEKGRYGPLIDGSCHGASYPKTQGVSPQ